MWSKVKGNLKLLLPSGHLPLHLNGVVVWCTPEVKGSCIRHLTCYAGSTKGYNGGARMGRLLHLEGTEQKNRWLWAKQEGKEKEKEENLSLKGCTHAFVSQFTSDWVGQEILSVGSIKEVPLRAFMAWQRLMQMLSWRRHLHFIVGLRKYIAIEKWVFSGS